MQEIQQCLLQVLTKLKKSLNGSGRLFIEMTFSRGRGYNSADQNKWPNQPIGVIPIDSIFTPVKKVNYAIEDTRVGQVTDFDRLTMEVWTDATIRAEEALSTAARILSNHLQIFIGLTDDSKDSSFADNEEDDERSRMLDTAIEDMDFSVRTYNCLKRAGINTVGDLAARSEEDMMKVRNR